MRGGTLDILGRQVEHTSRLRASSELHKNLCQSTKAPPLKINHEWSCGFFSYFFYAKKNMKSHIKQFIKAKAKRKKTQRTWKFARRQISGWATQKSGTNVTSITKQMMPTTWIAQFIQLRYQRSLLDYLSCRGVVCRAINKSWPKGKNNQVQAVIEQKCDMIYSDRDSA